MSNCDADILETVSVKMNPSAFFDPPGLAWRKTERDAPIQEQRALSWVDYRTDRSPLKKSCPDDFLPLLDSAPDRALYQARPFAFFFGGRNGGDKLAFITDRHSPIKSFLLNVLPSHSLYIGEAAKG